MKFTKTTLDTGVELSILNNQDEYIATGFGDNTEQALGDLKEEISQTRVIYTNLISELDELDKINLDETEFIETPEDNS